MHADSGGGTATGRRFFCRQWHREFLVLYRFSGARGTDAGRDYREGLDTAVCLLAGGDVTKRAAIERGCGPGDSELYLRRQFERQLADLAWAQPPWWHKPAGDETEPCWKKDQAVGEACGRRETQMAQCRDAFGEANLAALCRTCPGPGR